MPDKKVGEITDRQIWQQGLRLEWMERGGWPLSGLDMSAEIADIEEVVARIIGRRWKISLDNEE